MRRLAPGRRAAAHLPVMGAIDAESVAESAGGLVGVLAAVLGAVGLGMAADYLVNRVAARVVNLRLRLPDSGLDLCPVHSRLCPRQWPARQFYGK